MKNKHDLRAKKILQSEKKEKLSKLKNLPSCGRNIDFPSGGESGGGGYY